MENKYVPKLPGYKKKEFLKKAEKILASPKTEWVPLEEFLAKIENSD